MLQKRNYTSPSAGVGYPPPHASLRRRGVVGSCSALHVAAFCAKSLCIDTSHTSCAVLLVCCLYVAFHSVGMSPFPKYVQACFLSTGPYYRASTALGLQEQQTARHTLSQWTPGQRDSGIEVRRIVYAATTLNLLNPTGHVMHQQFNIQQLHVLPTLYLCVLYLSENKQRLVPLTA